MSSVCIRLGFFNEINARLRPKKLINSLPNYE